MYVFYMMCVLWFFFFSSRRRHTRCALVTVVQTCALPIYREIDAEQRTPTPFAIFDGFRNDLERHPAETQRLVQRARGVRLGILMLILVGRRTVGEFHQIAFGDPETGLFGFVDHPDEGDLGQSAFLLGIAAADVRVDAGEPELSSEAQTPELQYLMR